jgi:hypothetical protein
MSLPEIADWKAHVYVDMPAYARRELHRPARVAACGQPLTGGRTCLRPADEPGYHVPEVTRPS